MAKSGFDADVIPDEIIAETFSEAEEVKPLPSAEVIEEIKADKNFANVTAYPESIGFSDRTVTWSPYGVQTLKYSEYTDGVFLSRENKFKEVN